MNEFFPFSTSIDILMHFLMILQTTVVDIFRPENAGDTLKLIMNWDGMGKMILERYLIEQKERKNTLKISLSCFSVLDADGPVVDRCRAWCASAGTAYFRFSPIMATDIELDETDDKILVELMWSAMTLVYNKREDVRLLKNLLVEN